MLEQIGQDAEVLALLEAVPERVAETVRSFTPVDSGRTLGSISIRSRRTALRRLSTRQVNVGTVYSDDPSPERVASIEYGRGDGENGPTVGAKMFLKAAIAWDDRDLG